MSPPSSQTQSPRGELSLHLPPTLPASATRADRVSGGCRKAIAVEKELPVEFDLGLLAVYDPNPIEVDLYASVLPPSPTLSFLG